jgi:pimeloyl-ACP methyl ester carboxylesterase
MLGKMFPQFLPPAVAHLSEPTSIALAHQIQQRAIATPLRERPIPTAYVQQGQGGTPLLLLHGFDSSVLEFRRLLPELVPYRSSWAVDLLGFGFSDRPRDVSINPASITTHLYWFWKTLIQQPMVVVGASMGGAAALDLALSHPEVVAQLVLIDSAGLAQGPALGKLLIPPLGYIATEFLRHPRVRQQVSRKAYYDPTLVTPDAELCAALHLDMPDWSAALVDFTRSGGYTHLGPQRIAEIQQSTLVLWGCYDGILGTQDGLRFAQLIPQSRLVWLNRCGHVPHLEQPEATAAQILDWCESTQ